MPVQTDHLADDIKELTLSVNGLKTAFASFRGSVETQFALLKWIGVFFASVLVAVVGGAVAVSWTASSVVSEIKQQGVRLEKIERQLDQFAALRTKP
jgi:hypothetical protein